MIASTAAATVLAGYAFATVTGLAWIMSGLFLCALTALFVFSHHFEIGFAGDRCDRTVSN